MKPIPSVPLLTTMPHGASHDSIVAHGLISAPWSLRSSLSAWIHAWSTGQYGVGPYDPNRSLNAASLGLKLHLRIAFRLAVAAAPVSPLPERATDAGFYSNRHWLSPVLVSAYAQMSTTSMII